MRGSQQKTRESPVRAQSHVRHRRALQAAAGPVLGRTASIAAGAVSTHCTDPFEPTPQTVLPDATSSRNGESDFAFSPSHVTASPASVQSWYAGKVIATPVSALRTARTRARRQRNASPIRAQYKSSRRSSRLRAHCRIRSRGHSRGTVRRLPQAQQMAAPSAARAHAPGRRAGRARRRGRRMRWRRSRGSADQTSPNTRHFHSDRRARNVVARGYVSGVTMNDTTAGSMSPSRAPVARSGWLPTHHPAVAAARASVVSDRDLHVARRRLVGARERERRDPSREASPIPPQRHSAEYAAGREGTDPAQRLQHQQASSMHTPIHGHGAPLRCLHDCVSARCSPR